jgi:MFS family permease
LLLGGRLSDIVGQRRIFVIGFAILTAASIVAGLASSGTLLIAARALQGVGAALIAPSALSIVMSLFTIPAERNKAMGFWGAAAIQVSLSAYTAKTTGLSIRSSLEA